MQMRTAELNRLKTARYAAREYIEELLKYIEQQLAKVEQQINELMQQSEQLSAARKLLMSVPGVGPVTANIPLIRLPEILTLGPNAVAALAGLAPMANQSGSKDKRRRIHGGRQDVRNVLYSVGDALQPGHQALLSAADRAREGRTGGGHAQASVHLECDAQAQSAVEAELVSEHPLTFNTVTQHDSSMSDFAGLRSGGILDALRWHDRLITKTHLCKSELTFHCVLRARIWKPS